MYYCGHSNAPEVHYYASLRAESKQTYWLGVLQPGDGLFAFAPDSLDLTLTFAREQNRDLIQACVLAVHSIRTGPLPRVDFLLESDIRAHGAQAVALIQQWLQTNTPPAPVTIPLLETPHGG